MTAYYGSRGRIGLIVPPNNTVNENEWAAAMPDGVVFHATRMQLNPLARSPEEMEKLRADLHRTTAMMAEAELNVVVFGCTAPSAVSPRVEMEEFMTTASGLPSVTAGAAVVDAIKALGSKKVALMSPFSQKLTEHERDFLIAEGIEVTAVHGLGHGTYEPGKRLEIHRIAPEAVLEHVAGLDIGDAGTILLSGTNLVTFPVIAEIEARMGISVVTSNQATLWSALRKIGCQDKLPLGQLFAH
jgi:maleate cis-trans isomerase